MRKNLGVSYDNIVLTKHAKERSYERIINEDYIIEIMKNPDAVYELEDGKFKFIRKTARANFHVVGKPIPEEDKWLVISVWGRGIDTTKKPRKYPNVYQSKPYNRNRKRNTSFSDKLLLGFANILFFVLIIVLHILFS